MKPPENKSSKSQEASAPQPGPTLPASLLTLSGNPPTPRDYIEVEFLSRDWEAEPLGLDEISDLPEWVENHPDWPELLMRLLHGQGLPPEQSQPPRKTMADAMANAGSALSLMDDPDTIRAVEEIRARNARMWPPGP